MATGSEATIEDLYASDGKAEIVGGEIVFMSPTGEMPNYAAGEIYSSLRIYGKQKGGRVFTDNAAFLVDLPNRKSFSPDAAYYTGPRGKMKFLPQAPDFAVEVRSDGDYGPAAEQAMAEKRTDYFASGTKVVWDVDLLGEDIVRVYRASAPDEPTIYHKAETAEAEPAVPGWTFPVDDLFE